MEDLFQLTLNARRRNALSSDWLTPFSAGTVQVGYQGIAHTLEPGQRYKRTWKWLTYHSNTPPLKKLYAAFSVFIRMKHT